MTQHSNSYPKLGSTIEIGLLQRMLHHGKKLKHYTTPVGETLYYHSGGRYWRKALPTKLSSHYKPVTVPGDLYPIVFGLLNSQLFYWFWIGNSNCMDVVSREVLELPVFDLSHADSLQLREVMDRLLQSYYGAVSERQRRGEQIHTNELNFDISQSKPIIDEVDRVLAKYYGFADEELDFIINYDIKYRMGDALFRNERDE